ncbi:UDP-N-acetylmuramoyl-L-alanyl-D-glutamate--2,6-diaminopimelate ligase [Kushneria marisflavi]|uniref:UDP-N-acetylmuramoyl-L-alanyl-D-glutamate--2, 6-diaminopimelate ligase n=1 Tax=Kushneria marisflavi TaxID=157779 RepID=UPI000FF23414|nr:UDP-N-acetylmuramoyl-L-alanyl-D-glutamate--2,6-diaminopimelate ligase [Kushneria marisflavi]RKD76736.1 UDP-N-acetylmuramoylalanyl-D-glutamate--2,6-diaminopimelate ligase [Kushneria marisflavi]
MPDLPTSTLADAIARLWPDTDTLPLADEARLVLDSRHVETGDVFVALPGTRVDGRQYIDQARDRGAALILVAPPWQETADDLLILDDLPERLGQLASLVMGVPDSLEQIAVTGTNGKSSVTHYIAALSEALATPAGLIGTLGSGRPGMLEHAGLTTPDAISLQQRLRELAVAGAERVALEASSHALDQHRLSGCCIRAAVFTNLSRDHLDYHPSMAAYAAAKARLFQRPELELAVVNADDALARLMLAGVSKKASVLRVGSQDSHDFQVRRWQAQRLGLEAGIMTPEGERTLRLSLMGRFNLDNVLLAIATLYGLGSPLDALMKAAEQLTPVPGRMQLLARPDAPAVVVDYAHTPDALRNALLALREHVPGRLWCVLGCGGDRDTGKRPLMGGVAALLADEVVVTDDNPRSEPPEDIRRMIMSEMPQGAHVREVAGRAQAIADVVARAGAQDVILLAGKGHEDYQEIQGVRYPFSDMDVASLALEAHWHE